MIKEAHLGAIERLEAGRSRNYLTFAEQIRGHLFELGRMRNSSPLEVIERVFAKLPISDRVAWREGGRDQIETRSMEDFVNWLTTRATSYLSV